MKNISELENQIKELKGKQSAHFKKKKADRTAGELDSIRTELRDLKAQVSKIYRG
jgi:hypothetical protein